jgi:hypothetical protein
MVHLSLAAALKDKTTGTRMERDMSTGRGVGLVGYLVLHIARQSNSPGRAELKNRATSDLFNQSWAASGARTSREHFQIAETVDEPV